MAISFGDRLTRIGIFYDGNYFAYVSNYYCYHHPRKKRLSIKGLHDFIRSEVAALEGTDQRYSHIVDAHYFRGRLPAKEAQLKNTLYNERVFDLVLMREGVVTHYLPMGAHGEKGIDVWLSLEAFELSIFKQFNVVVLVACDGDYVPLARKLNALGVRVMVLGWDFEVNLNGDVRKTVTSQRLLDEATYPIMMSTLIDDKTKKNDTVVNSLFVETRELLGEVHELDGDDDLDDDTQPAHLSGGRRTGSIKALRTGYGFIAQDNGERDIYFYCNDLVDIDFNDLDEGLRVSYEEGHNQRGACARQIELI